MFLDVISKHMTYDTVLESARSVRLTDYKILYSCTFLGTRFNPNTKRLSRIKEPYSLPRKTLTSLKIKG